MSSREIMNSIDGKPTYLKIDFINKEIHKLNEIKQKDPVGIDRTYEVR
jgi:hypothetical protein